MTISDNLRDAIIGASQNSLDACVALIRHCLDQLTDNQIWWRPHDSMNSIGNLILHLCGNVKQWIVAGIGNTKDLRDRPSEFAQRGPIAKSELIEQLETTVAAAKAVLIETDAKALLAARRIQGFDASGVGAIFSCIPHFAGHTQEIVYLTRMQLGNNYRFHWQPKTREEGAPPEVRQR